MYNGMSERVLLPLLSCIWSFRSSPWAQLQRMVHKHRWIVIVPWLKRAIPDPLKRDHLCCAAANPTNHCMIFDFLKSEDLKQVSKRFQKIMFNSSWIQYFNLNLSFLIESSHFRFLNRDVTFWDFDLTRHWSLICDKQWIHRLSFAFRVTNALGMKTATWRHQLHWSGPAWEWTAWLEGVTCQKVKSAIIARLRLDTVIWLLGYAYAREVWIHWHGHHGTLWRLHRGAARTQGGHQCMRWRLNAHACTRIPCAQCQ